MTKGWKNDSQKHSVARKGIQTKGIVRNINSIKRIERKVGWMSKYNIMLILKEHGFSIANDETPDSLRQMLLMSVVNGTISEYDLGVEDLCANTSVNSRRYTL